MKVLQINAVYGVGSTGVIVEDMHNLSMENGIDSYVAYSTSRKRPDEVTNGYVIGKPFSKKMHGLLCRINGKQAYFSKGATKKLIEYIEKIKPDIVHLHNLHSNYIHLNIMLDFLGKNDISTVITLHDCWFYTGGCFHYTSVKCDKWLKECGNCPKKKGDTPAYLFDKSKKILADKKKYFGNIKDLTVVGVSEWISSEGEKTLFRGKTLTIHNGIDTEFFVNTPSEIRKELGIEDKYVILGMANKWLLPINRETLDYFSKNMPEDAVLVLVGCNSEQKTALPKNVIGMEYIRQRDYLKKVYSMADVFVNCTREDSLSLVNVEAQASETPTVTYRNTGAKETVDNENSFSVESGDCKKLIETAFAVSKKENGSKCRSFVCDKFDRNNNYLKFIELYNKIYENKKGEDYRR